MPSPVNLSEGEVLVQGNPVQTMLYIYGRGGVGSTEFVLIICFQFDLKNDEQLHQKSSLPSPLGIFSYWVL